ncbi:MAG TPA: gephyrin-like molybdotransferase Glp [Gaiellaceae bacterium]
MAELLSLAEARAAVLERVVPLPAEPVALGEAGGRVLAEDAVSTVDLPPFPSSAMDGFAVRAADSPGRLVVVGSVAAGAPATAGLRAGEAMGIATGGAVPPGADAVVRIEDVVLEGNTVEIPGVGEGKSIRPRGGDIREGEVVVEKGTRMGAAHVAALAAAGAAGVSVSRRPRVAVLATGSELRPPGELLGPGQIFDANGVLLATALSAAGAEVEVLPAVEDDPDAHRDALERGLGADVLVTTGGVSVGPHDLVRSILRSLGVEEVFWGVAVKPGKPLAFGVLGTTLVFGLPGNPVSTLVGCELFVRPAVLALQGAPEPGPVYRDARLAAAVKRNAGRDELLRARTRFTDDGVVVEPVTGQESHMIVRAAGADALVLSPRGNGELPEGSHVRYFPLA